MRIAIIDQNNAIVTTLETTNPEFSFEQYCRNRETAGWRWEKA